MKMSHNLLASAVTIAALLAPLTSHAATSVAAGSLIKSPASAAVYFMASNGKRYVFPNEKAYKTWYPTFANVQTISVADMGNIGIGGNVTYRPGVRLLKIESDPKVYAVDTGHRLRWISSGDVAASIYGANWNLTSVDDLPDSFFVNYNLGSSINVSSDFDKSAAMQAEATLDASLTGGLSM